MSNLKVDWLGPGYWDERHVDFALFAWIESERRVVKPSSVTQDQILKNYYELF